MAWFRLKAGSFSVGSGKDQKFYKASDPKRNIIESEQNLARMMPEKFELYDSPFKKEQSTKAVRQAQKAAQSPPPEQQEQTEEQQPQDQQKTAAEEERKKQMLEGFRRQQQAEISRLQEIDGKLDRMSVEQLRTVVAEEEIDLPRPNMPKQELLAQVRQFVRAQVKEVEETQPPE